MANQVAAPLKTKEFKEQLNSLLDDVDNLITYSEAVATARANKQVLVDAAGAKIGKREIKHMRSEFAKKLRALSKDYALALKPKKKTGTKKSGTGFNRPMYVSDDLRDFFIEANNLGRLGYADPKNPAAGKLGDQLHLLINVDYQNAIARNNGLESIPAITSAGLLTALFAIYATLNELTKNALRNQGKTAVQMDHQYLGADDLMNKYFADTFARLTARGPHYTAKEIAKAQAEGRAPKQIPAFNPRDFRYAAFQSIVAQNRRTADGFIKVGDVQEPNPAGPALSEQEKALLTSPELIAELAKEQQAVSAARIAYQAQMEGARKELRKAKKQAQKAAGK